MNLTAIANAHNTLTVACPHLATGKSRSCHFLIKLEKSRPKGARKFGLYLRSSSGIDALSCFQASMQSFDDPERVRPGTVFAVLDNSLTALGPP
jgi:hypothetical protein